MRSFLSDVGIQLEVPPVKESWSHGIMERCVQEIKTVASKLTLSHPEMSVQNVLALTTMALNSTETVRGFSPYQWVYGQKFTLDDEDERTMAQLTPSTAALDFTQLMVNRREAEAMARQVHAQRVLVKLKNSKVRQPLQVFKPMDLVKIWRKYSADGGPRGGLKRSADLNGLVLDVWCFMKSSMDNMKVMNAGISSGSSLVVLCIDVQFTVCEKSMNENVWNMNFTTLKILLNGRV